MRREGWGGGRINRGGGWAWSRMWATTNRRTRQSKTWISLPKIQVMAPSASKKRKRDDVDEGEGERISFKLSALPENQLGPVLGQFSRYRRWWLEMKEIFRQLVSLVYNPQPTFLFNAISSKQRKKILQR